MQGERVHKNKNKIQSLLIKKAQSNLEDGFFITIQEALMVTTNIVLPGCYGNAWKEPLAQ